MARKVKESGEGHLVREGPAVYNSLFGAENEDIGPANTYFWDVNAE
jgi:hypothetical protein